MSKRKPLEEKINIELQDSNTYNALVEIALLTDSYLFFDYEKKEIMLKSKDDPSFDKGFQLSPYFNMQEMDVSLTGESLYPILHVEGGVSDTGLLINLVPALSYHQWEALLSKWATYIDGLDSGEKEKAIRDMRNGVFFNKNKGALGVEHWDEKVLMQMEHVPYIDSFLVAFDYFEEQEFVDPNDSEYKSFLEDLYLNLTGANLDLQVKNIKNMLIEEQIRRIQRKIEATAEEVAADTTDDYEQEISKLDSLFLEKGGRETTKEEFTGWVDGDDPIEGTDIHPRDIYLDKWIFVQVSAEEYFSLLEKELEGEEDDGNNDYRGFSDWEGEPLEGTENPKVVHSANQKYFYSESIDNLHGFKVRLEEENTKGETRTHILKDFVGDNMGKKTIKKDTLSDPIDNKKWKTFDSDKTYDKKEYEVSLTPDAMNIIGPFKNKIGNTSNDRMKIVAKGLQRIPVPEKIDSTSEKRFPIEEGMWDLPKNTSVAGYYKVRKDLELQDPESNNQWRDVSGNKDIYSGWTSSKLSYPQKEDKFPSWIESVIGTKEVEYYELNDRFTLALVQGVDAFLFDKYNIGRDRDNSRIGISGKAVYRVFFYSDTRFALVYGDDSNYSETTAELYDVSVSGRDPWEPMESVSFDNIHPHLVTGGYYRDEVVTIGGMETTSSGFSDPGRYDADFTVDGLGRWSEGVGVVWHFDLNTLEQDAKEVFTNLPTNYRLNDTDRASLKAWPSNTFSVSGLSSSISAGGLYKRHYYRFNVTYNISSGEPKEAIYYKDGYIIMARTWDATDVEKKAWQYARFADWRDSHISGDYGTWTKMIVAVGKSLFLKRHAPNDNFVLMYAFTGKETFPEWSTSLKLSWTKPPYIVLIDSGPSWDPYDIAHIFDGDRKITRVRSNDLSIYEHASSKKLLYSGKGFFVGVSEKKNYSVGEYYGLTFYYSYSYISKQANKEFPQSIRIDGDIVFLPFRDRFYFKRDSNNFAWKIDKNHQKQFAPNIPSQDQLEDAVKSGNLNRGTMLYHREKEYTDQYIRRKMDWGTSFTKSTISNSGATLLIKEALIERTKRGFDLLRYNTPYLDLLDVYKGYNYLRDLNYSYLREIDYYIQERKRIESLIEEQGGAADGFYDAELESIEAEIGDINGYLIKDLTQEEEGEGEGKFWEEGEFWKYRTKEEYMEATGRKDIEDLAWKDYSLLLKNNEISFGDSSGMWAVEVRTNKYETGVFKIRANEDETGVDISAFWSTVIFDYEEPTNLTLSTDGEVLIRSVISFDPKSPSLIDAMNAIIDWSDYRDSSGDTMEPIIIEEGVTPDHAKVFFSQPERFTGASTESEQFGYATKKGRLSLKQERFQMFMEEREKLVLDSKKTLYPDSTHGQVVQARKEKEKIWFDMKKKYPELLLEGYYTNETENDSFNLMVQALENYKYHNRPSEEYGITYIDVQDLEGESSLVEVGDRVEIKSRMLRDLMPNDKKEQKKLQVTGITRELRNPSNIQLEVSPIKKSNLSEKLLDLIKRK